MPPCMGCQSSVERLLSLFYLSIHPSVPDTSICLSAPRPPLQREYTFLFLRSFLAHKTCGGGLTGCVFRVGYTAMCALTWTNAILATHLPARSYEKTWSRNSLRLSQQRAIIHHTAKQRATAQPGFARVPQPSHHHLP